MDPVQRNIVATENLLEALHKDSSLLDDDGFMQRLALLRAKHEQTTRILKREIGLSASYGPETWSHRGCEPYHSRISTATTGRTFVVAEGRRRRSEEEEEDVSRLEDFATSSHVVEEQYFDDLTSIGSVADFASNYEPPTRIEYMQKSYEEEKEEKKGNSEQKKTRISVVKPRAKSRSTTDLSTKASTRQDSAPSNNRSNEFFVPQITLPQPFKLSTRKPLPNTYAKKFLDEMLIEKEKSELAKNKQHEGLLFKANPVPPTTYKSTNPLVNDEKYVNAMRRKVASIAQRRFQQNSLGRSKSEGSLAGIKRTGHVPATTYVSPIPRKAYERSRSASRRGIDLLKEATTPPGIKVHEASSNRAFDLRHSRCRVEKMTTTGARRVSPPDFGKLHAQMDEKLRKTSPKPTTVAVPFNFVKPPVSRHRDCVAETTSPQPKPWRRSKSSVSRTPVVVSNYAAQLREELNRAKQTEINGNNNGNVWSETNKQKVAAFLASRSKSSEDIAARTREKMQQQKERTRDYLRQLAEMKQRVLNGPLVMERQTALAQEHRFQRRFQQRMRSANLRIDTEKNNNHKRLSRHDSQASNATFVAVGHSSNQDHQDSLQNPYDDSSESELAPSKEKSSAQNSERSSVSSGSSSSKSSASSSASTSSSASSHGSRSTS